MDKLNTTSKQINLSIIGLITFFIVFYSIFIYYICTPSHTAQMIRFSYQKNDFLLLKDYIDLNSVVDNCYDDVTSDLYKNSKMPFNITDLYIQYYKIIKKSVCEGTVQFIDNYLQTKEWSKDAEPTLLRGRELGIDYNELLKRSLLCDTKIVKIGEIKKDNRDNQILIVTVKDKYTNTPFNLELLLKQNSNGIYQVVKILNYRMYLIHVHTLCAKDLDNYIKMTNKEINAYNEKFLKLQGQFKKLANNINLESGKNERENIVKFIDDKIIPEYKSRGKFLMDLTVPVGAKHLHNLRLESNELTIKAWQQYAKGLATKNQEELTKAENTHKQAMVIEQKVKDILMNMPALFMPDTP